MRALAAGVAGRILAAVFALIAVVRKPRPIHSRGIMLDGEITRLAVRPTSGISWIDDAGAAPLAVTARVSRSVGLPSPLPDVIGLAMRFEHDGGTADIEFASTGLGVPWRFLLRPHFSPSHARLSIVLPYRGRRGPVLLCARTLTPGDLPPGGPPLAAALGEAPWRLRLYHARPTGTWHPFVDLALRRPVAGMPAEMRFDVGRHPLPGADTYEWVRAVRQPSYDAVQD